MSLFWRVYLTVAAIDAFVLLVLVSLSVVQYGSLLSGLISSRLLVIATNVGQPFQAVIDLGLAPENVRNAKAILARAQQGDPEIINLSVFDKDGSFIVSSAQDLPSKQVPPAMLATSARQGLTALETSTRIYVASPLMLVNGSRAGGVLVEYGNAGRDVQVRAMAAKLAALAGGVLAATFLLAWLALTRALGTHIRFLDGLVEAYGAFERRMWRADDSGNLVPSVYAFGYDTANVCDLLESTEKNYLAAKAAAGRHE